MCRVEPSLSSPKPVRHRPLQSAPCIQIRRLHNELEDLGMLDNAVFVLASDNGGCPIAGGSNYPFRGFKHTLFEGGVRVPAFVYSKSEALIPAEVWLCYRVLAASSLAALSGSGRECIPLQ